ncbi:hypothetical protein MZD04_gp350 [Pseudomonas phage Psa21]|uniref:Uncharacterized protein n=1 Tax=Pseudomonas phage Psa21 TaxID=2530023 RepID=A0A481W4X2_9CAUD|nr:hypothetical protein MZD04_gp350 [Pseudomonas phage Psa21]QBJ02876.1 hypothetical protein PSA21_350 [Pseudomonas phage Psa21]
MSRKVPTKQELEEAYAKVAEIEAELVQEAADARILLFTEMQCQVNDRAIPTFRKGATMSQAFRMGIDAGIEVALDSMDRRGITLIDGDDRLLNVAFAHEGPDLLPMNELWASYINS